MCFCAGIHQSISMGKLLFKWLDQELQKFMEFYRLTYFFSLKKRRKTDEISWVGETCIEKKEHQRLHSFVGGKFLYLFVIMTNIFAIVISLRWIFYRVDDVIEWVWKLSFENHSNAFKGVKFKSFKCVYNQQIFDCMCSLSVDICVGSDFAWMATAMKHFL